jgi:hypothetical protein
LVAGEPQPLEASELRWVKPGELDHFPMGKIDRLIAARIQERAGLDSNNLTTS